MEQPREPKFYPNEGIHIPVSVDTEELDCMIMKARELVALLREANELINSLSNNRC